MKKAINIKRLGKTEYSGNMYRVSEFEAQGSRRAGDGIMEDSYDDDSGYRPWEIERARKEKEGRVIMPVPHGEKKARKK